MQSEEEYNISGGLLNNHTELDVHLVLHNVRIQLAEIVSGLLDMIHHGVLNLLLGNIQSLLLLGEHSRNRFIYRLSHPKTYTKSVNMLRETEYFGVVHTSRGCISG